MDLEQLIAARAEKLKEMQTLNDANATMEVKQMKLSHKLLLV